MLQGPEARAPFELSAMGAKVPDRLKSARGLGGGLTTTTTNNNNNDDNNNNDNDNNKFYLSGAR